MFLVLGVRRCVFSCNQKDKTLPASTGSSSEILFVSPDYLWENKLSNKVLDIFSQDIPGIAKSEQAFKILHVNEGQLNSLLKTHTNIIILSSDSTFFEANKWAKNQLVSYLFYNDDANRFNAECNNLFKIYYDKEINAVSFPADLLLLLATIGSNFSYSLHPFLTGLFYKNLVDLRMSGNR